LRTDNGSVKAVTRAYFSGYLFYHETYVAVGVYERDNLSLGAERAHKATHGDGNNDREKSDGD
jgi:hypothetical protein